MNATRISFIDCSQWGNNERVNIRIESFYLSTFVQTTVVYSLKFFFFVQMFQASLKPFANEGIICYPSKFFFSKSSKEKKIILNLLMRVSIAEHVPR